MSREAVGFAIGAAGALIAGGLAMYSSPAPSKEADIRSHVNVELFKKHGEIEPVKMLVETTASKLALTSPKRWDGLMETVDRGIEDLSEESLNALQTILAVLGRLQGEKLTTEDAFLRVATGHLFRTFKKCLELDDPRVNADTCRAVGFLCATSDLFLACTLQVWLTANLLPVLMGVIKRGDAEASKEAFNVCSHFCRSPLAHKHLCEAGFVELALQFVVEHGMRGPWAVSVAFSINSLTQTQYQGEFPTVLETISPTLFIDAVNVMSHSGSPIDVVAVYLMTKVAAVPASMPGVLLDRKALRSIVYVIKQRKATTTVIENATLVVFGALKRAHEKSVPIVPFLVKECGLLAALTKIYQAGSILYAISILEYLMVTDGLMDELRELPFLPNLVSQIRPFPPNDYDRLTDVDKKNGRDSILKACGVIAILNLNKLRDIDWVSFISQFTRAEVAGQDYGGVGALMLTFLMWSTSPHTNRTFVERVIARGVFDDLCELLYKPRDNPTYTSPVPLALTMMEPYLDSAQRAKLRSAIAVHVLTIESASTAVRLVGIVDMGQFLSRTVAYEYIDQYRPLVDSVANLEAIVSLGRGEYTASLPVIRQALFVFCARFGWEEGAREGFENPLVLLSCVSALSVGECFVLLKALRPFCNRVPSVLYRACISQLFVMADSARESEATMCAKLVFDGFFTGWRVSLSSEGERPENKPLEMCYIGDDDPVWLMRQSPVMYVSGSMSGAFGLLGSRGVTGEGVYYFEVDFMNHALVAVVDESVRPWRFWMPCCVAGEHSYGAVAGMLNPPVASIVQTAPVIGGSSLSEGTIGVTLCLSAEPGKSFVNFSVLPQESGPKPYLKHVKHVLPDDAARRVWRPAGGVSSFGQAEFVFGMRSIERRKLTRRPAGGATTWAKACAGLVYGVDVADETLNDYIVVDEVAEEPAVSEGESEGDTTDAPTTNDTNTEAAAENDDTAVASANSSVGVGDSPTPTLSEVEVAVPSTSAHESEEVTVDAAAAADTVADTCETETSLPGVSTSESVVEGDAADGGIPTAAEVEEPVDLEAEVTSGTVREFFYFELKVRYIDIRGDGRLRIGFTNELTAAEWATTPGAFDLDCVAPGPGNEDNPDVYSVLDTLGIGLLQDNRLYLTKNGKLVKVAREPLAGMLTEIDSQEWKGVSIPFVLVSTSDDVVAWNCNLKPYQFAVVEDKIAASASRAS